MAKDKQFDRKRQAEFLATRLGIGILNVLIVVGSKLSTGDLSEPLDKIIVGVALIPTLIFTAGATDRGINDYGLLILGLTAGAWLLLGITREPLLGIYTVPVFGATLALAIKATRSKTEDPKHSRPPWWNPTT